MREPSRGELEEYREVLEELTGSDLGIADREVTVERIRGPVRADRVFVDGRPVLTVTFDPWTASCVYTLTPHGAREAEEITGERPERRRLVRRDPYGLLDFEPTGTKRDLEKAVTRALEECDVDILELETATERVNGVELTGLAVYTAREFLYVDVVPPDPAGRPNPVNAVARILHAFGGEETRPWVHPEYRFLGVRRIRDGKVARCRLGRELIEFEARITRAGLVLRSARGD
ncbi:hypothetical protein [Methanopyrus kandleri]